MTVLGKIVIGEDALSGHYRWIVVPVVSNGTNTTEMHVMLATRCNWPQLRDMSFLELGGLSQHHFEDRLLFAAVCYEYVQGYFRFYPEFVTACLDTIACNGGDAIALVSVALGEEQFNLLRSGVDESTRLVDIFLPEPVQPARKPEYDYPLCRSDQHLSRNDLGLDSFD